MIFDKMVALDTSKVGVPMISYVYMGMSEPDDLSAGWYNSITVDMFRENNYDVEKTSEQSKKLIEERLSYFAHNTKEFISFTNFWSWK